MQLFNFFCSVLTYQNEFIFYFLEWKTCVCMSEEWSEVGGNGEVLRLNTSHKTCEP